MKRIRLPFFLDVTIEEHSILGIENKTYDI